MKISALAFLLAVAMGTLSMASKDCRICPPKTSCIPEASSPGRLPDPEYSPAFEWTPIEDGQSKSSGILI